MAPAEVTWPNALLRSDSNPVKRVVSTPEYCTVLKTLLAVARISKLRVSPSCMVFESDMLFWMVPGPGMELRDALPKALPNLSVAGAVNAAVLNQCLMEPPPAVR